VVLAFKFSPFICLQYMHLHQCVLGKYNVPLLFLVFLTFYLPKEYWQSCSSSVSGSVLFYSLYIATLAQSNRKRWYNETTSMNAFTSVLVKTHWSFLEHKYWTLYYYINTGLLYWGLCDKSHQLQSLSGSWHLKYVGKLYERV